MKVQLVLVVMAIVLFGYQNCSKNDEAKWGQTPNNGFGFTTTSGTLVTSSTAKVLELSETQQIKFYTAEEITSEMQPITESSADLASQSQITQPSSQPTTETSQNLPGQVAPSQVSQPSQQVENKEVEDKEVERKEIEVKESEETEKNKDKDKDKDKDVKSNSKNNSSNSNANSNSGKNSSAVSRKMSSVLFARFEYSYEFLSNSMSKINEQGQVVQNYCLSDAMKNELTQILTTGSVCKASPVLSEDTVCAEVIKEPYAEIIKKDNEIISLGSATNSCGSDLTDLCGQHPDMLKGWFKNFQNNLQQFICE